MPTPPNASTANADSLADLTALQTAANNLFISQAADAINGAIAQGLYFVVLTTFQNCNIQNLQTYFKSLGYQIDYPDQLNPNLNPYNPAELFGPDLDNYWMDNGTFPVLTNPTRIRIKWVLP